MERNRFSTSFSFSVLECTGGNAGEGVVGEDVVGCGATSGPSGAAGVARVEATAAVAGTEGERGGTCSSVAQGVVADADGDTGKGLLEGVGFFPLSENDVHAAGGASGERGEKVSRAGELVVLLPLLVWLPGNPTTSSGVGFLPLSVSIESCFGSERGVKGEK